jgi:hypothetical protein
MQGEGFTQQAEVLEDIFVAQGFVIFEVMAHLF